MTTAQHPAEGNPFEHPQTGAGGPVVDTLSPFPAPHLVGEGDLSSTITSLRAALEAVPPYRSPLRLRFSLNALTRVLWQRDCEKATEEDMERMRRHPLAQEIITNDGSVTYGVHSTTLANAPEIMAHGLKVAAGKHRDPTTPHLDHTLLMLAGPNTLRERFRGWRERFNLHALAYRYAGRRDNAAKVVFCWPVPNPGRSKSGNPFRGTFLSKADGVNLIEISSTGEGEYLIPPTRSMGYFNQDSGEFIPNPDFEQPRAPEHL